MKKMIISAAAVMAASVIGFSMSAAAAPIDIETAKEIALKTVGLTEDQVILKQTETDTDDGKKIIEIDFFIPGEVKYEYDIDQETGAILEQDIDLWEADDDTEYADLIKAAKDGITNVTEAVKGEISELQAKTIALKDAGLKADEVRITKCKRDEDDGVWQFEIELKLADGTEYDYEIKASDGTIVDKDVDKDIDFDDVDDD